MNKIIENICRNVTRLFFYKKVFLGIFSMLTFHINFKQLLLSIMSAKNINTNINVTIA